MAAGPPSLLFTDGIPPTTCLVLVPVCDVVLVNRAWWRVQTPAQRARTLRAFLLGERQEDSAPRYVWVQNPRAPDDWEQQPVGFKRRFDSTVTLATAFPEGRGNPSLLPGLNLELWGVPTSLPARDPANSDFVYQRFQRGVMHYDRATGATQGLLLAAYLRAVLTGEELPADLDAQVRGSRLYRQYERARPAALARPDQLPDSDLTNAFEREAPAR